MSNGIQLFDSKARMLPLDQIEPQLDTDDARAAFAAVKEAYEASHQIDAALSAAQEHVTVLMGSVADAEKFLKDHFPKRSFMDEWRAMKNTA